MTQRHESAAVEPQDSPTVRLNERRQRLAELIAAKLEQGCWVEYQRDTDAVLVSQGPRRWLGRVGPREENRREAVAVDAQGNATIDVLPRRRY